MMRKSTGVQTSMFTTSLDDVVPEDHFLRRLDKAVNFDFIYKELEPYYCANNGKYSTDPVVIVKSLLIGFLYGIDSERRIEQETMYNVAYRWFLGLGFDERVPDHSTISQLRRRKFNDADLFKKLFTHVLMLCVEAGLVSGKLLVTDSTHIKANASKKSKIKVEVEQEVTEYIARLDAYEAEERKRLGMPDVTRKTPEPKKTIQTKSTTDPDAGWLARTGKPEGFHYLSHQTIDSQSGIIVDVAVTAGNTPDHVPYLRQIDNCVDKLNELNIEVEAVCADALYDTAIIHKEMEARNLKIYTVEKISADLSKVDFKRDLFTYDQNNDEFTCPCGEVLKLRTVRRESSSVYREYGITSKVCKQCPNREHCLAPSQKSRRIRVNIFQDIVDKHRSAEGSDEYNAAMRIRQFLCEGTFGTQKTQHNLKQLLRRGLDAAEDHCLLSATAMNLKRMVKCMT